MLLNGYVTSQQDNELKYSSLHKQPFPRLLPYIVKQFYGSIVITKPSAKVITIELKFNITLVFGLAALIKSPQVFLSEILSTVRASHRKNRRPTTLILATYPLFFSAHGCS